MKHLKTFEGLFSFLKNKGLSKYLVTYKVTNYEATEEDWKKGRYSRDWVSNDYEYVIDANSEEEAKDKFRSLWNKEVDSFEPRPKLDIVSTKQIPDKEFSVGSFKNQLKFY